MKKTRLIVGVMLLSASQLVSAEHNLTTEAGLLAAVKEAGQVSSPGMHRTLVTNLGGSKDPGKVLRDAVQKVYADHNTNLTNLTKVEANLAKVKKEAATTSGNLAKLRQNVRDALGAGKNSKDLGEKIKTKVANLEKSLQEETAKAKKEKERADKCEGDHKSAKGDIGGVKKELAAEKDKVAGLEKEVETEKDKTQQERDKYNKLKTGNKLEKKKAVDLTKQLEETKKTLAAAQKTIATKTAALDTIKDKAGELKAGTDLEECSAPCVTAVNKPIEDILEAVTESEFEDAQGGGKNKGGKKKNKKKKKK